MIYGNKIGKTKKIIITTMFELLKYKNFNKITISDIVEKSNINRSTFYRHFLDKYDLLDKIENNMINYISIRQDEMLVSFLKINNVPVEHFSALIDECLNNIDYLKIFLENSDNNSFEKKLKLLIKNKLEKIFIFDDKTISNNKTELIYHFSTTNVLASLRFFIENPNIEKNEAINFISDMYNKGLINIILETRKD